MPTIQSGLDLTTYADAIDYILDSHAIDRTGLNERHARAAVRTAYRDLPIKHSWNYYQRQQLLQTVADYATGTVVFDFTGGAYERMLTLTSGTWPSWAAYGRVIIDNVHYEVATRESDSIITLSTTSNPGDDVASTTYTIYRNSYPLPVNFRGMVQLWDVASNCEVPWVDQRAQHTALQAFYDTPDTPRHVTIRSTGKYLGGAELVFGPPPTAIYTYDLLFEAFPRPLAIDEYGNGTVAITSGTAAVTGTSTTFPATCAGSIIRFSSGSVKPSGPLGAIDGADNPFIYQGVIKSRDSATALTLEEVMPTTIATLSGVGYTISDPIDIDANRMLSAFQRYAEAEFSRLSGKEYYGTLFKLARQTLIEAMEGDDVAPNPRIGSTSTRESRIANATVSNSS